MALNALADVKLVTSIREGINLGAMEFIACQQHTRHGYVRGYGGQASQTARQPGTRRGRLLPSVVWGSVCSSPCPLGEGGGLSVADRKGERQAGRERS